MLASWNLVPHWQVLGAMFCLPVAFKNSNFLALGDVTQRIALGRKGAIFFQAVGRIQLGSPWLLEEERQIVRSPLSASRRNPPDDPPERISPRQLLVRLDDFLARCGRRGRGVTRGLKGGADERFSKIYRRRLAKK